MKIVDSEDICGHRMEQAYDNSELKDGIQEVCTTVSSQLDKVFHDVLYRAVTGMAVILGNVNGNGNASGNCAANSSNNNLQLQSAKDNLSAAKQKKYDDHMTKAVGAYCAL